MRDERLICGIKQDDRVVFECVIDPRFELCSVIHGAGGVIRRAEIDNVGLDVFIRHTEEDIDDIADVALCAVADENFAEF